jgi:hypothetical protein
MFILAVTPYASSVFAFASKDENKTKKKK